MIELSIVVPCFNEEEALPIAAVSLQRLVDDLVTRGRIDASSQIIFVDDGSRDQTWQLIVELAGRSRLFQGIKLSCNCGHQNALLAGLFHSRGQAVITVDADLQDDLGAIEGMLDAYEQGHEIVYGVREDRRSDSGFKRYSAESYYRIMAAMGVKLVFNHADYRLMSRRAVDALRQFNEVNLFLRGVIPLLGFKSATVTYTRLPRVAGDSKYPLHKMLALAWQGVTSFSAVPLRIITALGFMVSLGSFAVSAWALWIRLVEGDAVPGWASTVLPIYLLGGIQLFCIGVIGEYLGKIYLEAKQRPRYLIDSFAQSTDSSGHLSAVGNRSRPIVPCAD